MEEERLVKHLRDGNALAFRTLYETYHRPLYGFCLRFVKSPTLAEEAVHDVFLKVWDRRTALRADTSFQSYLFTIAKNIVINQLQRASKEKEIIQQIAIHLPATRSSTEDELVLKDYMHHAQQAIDRLPPQRKLIYEACRFQGKSYEETARQYQISRETVKDHVVKAHKAIRHYLQTYAQISISVLLGWFIAVISSPV